ncbi:hypothetical protein [Ktedonosporobacter rubrisoli]|uniref:hypothetical protein n=1 Tax=Ktedonosporobacter rubrisoli TaxID=2509675 RepID=UPI0013EEB3DA|nr:hypothetical protein [Ktedonosporobacter rubrisoli]
MTNAITLLVREEQTRGLPTDLPLVGWSSDPGPFSGEMRFLTLAQPTFFTRG